jgi:hypothetical protein
VKGYFSVRELVFAAITVVGMQVWTIPAIAVSLPWELSSGVLGLSNMAVAPVCSFLLAVALVRIRKPGAVLLITGIYALAAMMGPGVYVACFILMGGLISELVCSAVFRGYRTAAAQVAGPVLYHLGMFPSVIFLRSIGVLSSNTPLGAYPWWAYLVAAVGITVASAAGAVLGVRVARELVKAGKLRADDPKPAEPAPAVTPIAEEPMRVSAP